MTTPETRVKNKIRDYLKSLGCWYYFVMNNGMGRHGCPDILVCHNGRLFAIEVKAPGKLKNTTPNQDREIAWINASGGVAVVVDNVDAVKELLTSEQD
jgi:hypothetical protein